MAQPVLDRRTLNRTLLERQLLLERVSRPASQVIEHLVGMQAQEPLNPHLALWSRIDGFDPAELSGLLERREAVRANTVWRTTIHLVTARDAPIMRALTQPLARRTFARTSFGQALAGLDPDEIAAVGRRMLARRPLTGPELGDRLARRFPGYDRNALALAVRWLVPTVQVPPRGVWGKAGPPTLAPLETWLGRRLPRSPLPDEMVLRYLRAFGPASTADIRTWSGLANLREVVDRLGGRLRRFRDESGRELLDVQDGPIAHTDLPAPVRFFPQYDNVFLSHADRSRVIPSGARDSVAFPFGGGGWVGSFTVDGFAGGAWRINRSADRATLVLRPVRKLTSAQSAELEAEGVRLLDFILGSGAEPQVEFAGAR